MKIKMFQVDAFANKVFTGNPAAVCILNEWLDDSMMQSIAQENNLSETAFITRKKQHYEIRWFTPKIEVDYSKYLGEDWEMTYENPGSVVSNHQCFMDVCCHIVR